MAGVTPQSLLALKQQGRKFVCLTAYDASFARLADAAGVETVLVGDSLGMVLQGRDSTLPVTMDDMAYHVRCVASGIRNALIIGDLPFMSYATTPQALDSAARLMAAGAHMVKLEGGAWLAETIRALTERGVPVCGHLGLTPQSVNILGGFRVQGRDPAQADRIINDAKVLQDSGCSLIVIECVPAILGERLAQTLRIPVIGIGAGAATDAQVLVLHDMLGLTENPPRFVRNFMAGASDIRGAIEAYASAVRSGEFPSDEHCFKG